MRRASSAASPRQVAPLHSRSRYRGTKFEPLRVAGMQGCEKPTPMQTFVSPEKSRRKARSLRAHKIVQAAVVAILTPIYEAEFLGFSYGFRPKRNQHQRWMRSRSGSGSGGSTGCSILELRPRTEIPKLTQTLRLLDIAARPPSPRPRLPPSR